MLGHLTALALMGRSVRKVLRESPNESNGTQHSLDEGYVTIAMDS